MSNATATKTASKYKFGVAADGQQQWRQEAYYDRMTQAPSIVAVFATEEEAQEWIDAEMARQERTIQILPGQGYHTLYGIYDLGEPTAYLSRQNAGRDHCNIGLRKKALMAALFGGK